jgi:hypothetical protein
LVSPIPYYIMNMRLQKIGLSFLCLIILFSSCQWKVQEKKKEDNNMTISVIRFDKLLNDYVEFNSFSALQKMNTECPMEMKLLIEDILGLGEVNEDNINGKLKTFYSDPTLQALMKDALPLGRKRV